MAEDAFEDLVNDNFKFYKKVSDDPEVSKEFFTRLSDAEVAFYDALAVNESAVKAMGDQANVERRI